VGKRALATAGAAVGILVLTACTPPAPTPTPTAQPFDTAKVEAAFQEAAADLDQVGALLLVRTAAGDFTSSYGTAERGTETPPSADMSFRIGSNTKTFTGTVILQLAQEGRLALDDPVSKYRADVPNGDDITIAQLLEMRAGLASYTFSDAWSQAAFEDPYRVWSPEEVAAIGLGLPPDFAPGTRYEYSNTNTVLLGLIAEQLDGEPLARIFHDRLFEPLGLEHTYLPEADDAELPAPRAHGYADVQSVGQDATGFNPSWGWAAGGAVSTAEDLATWAAALTDGSLLDPAMQTLRIASVRSMPTDPDSPTWAGWGYGLGLALVDGYYGHTGELPGYNSFMGSSPAAGMQIIVWANYAPAPDGRNPANEIADAVIAALGTA